MDLEGHKLKRLKSLILDIEFYFQVVGGCGAEGLKGY